MSDANQVFVVEVKNSPSKEYMNEFLEHLCDLKRNIIVLATQHNVYVMAYREWEYLDILNFEDVQKKEP